MGLGSVGSYTPFWSSSCTLDARDSCVECGLDSWRIHRAGDDGMPKALHPLQTVSEGRSALEIIKMSIETNRQKNN